MQPQGYGQPGVVYAQQPGVIYAQQPGVVYAQQQPGVVYAQQQPGVVYAQQPGVVYAQQPQPGVVYAQQPQPMGVQQQQQYATRPQHYNPQGLREFYQHADPEKKKKGIGGCCCCCLTIIAIIIITAAGAAAALSRCNTMRSDCGKDCRQIAKAEVYDSGDITSIKVKNDWIGVDRFGVVGGELSDKDIGPYASKVVKQNQFGFFVYNLAHGGKNFENRVVYQESEKGDSLMIQRKNSTSSQASQDLFYCREMEVYAYLASNYNGDIDVEHFGGTINFLELGNINFNKLTAKNSAGDIKFLSAVRGKNIDVDGNFGLDFFGKITSDTDVKLKSQVRVLVKDADVKSLDITSSTGSITIEPQNKAIANNIKITQNGARIELSKIQFGTLRTALANGPTAADQEGLKISTKLGSVTISDFYGGGNVDIHTTGGAVTFTLKRDLLQGSQPYSWFLKLKNGKISVTCPQNIIPPLNCKPGEQPANGNSITVKGSTNDNECTSNGDAFGTGNTDTFCISIVIDSSSSSEIKLVVE